MEEANDDMHSPKLLAGRELSDRRAKAISTDERNLVKICKKSLLKETHYWYLPCCPTKIVSCFLQSVRV